ncbi:hypothetical protein AB6V29_09435 [Microbacterium sp. 20-116]|uniref:Uncharacterized protein n=1 Tax=Microbacterium testaceum TaxID=2033 RepID=A0A4Y3QGZ4_MICTE|nr:MULTISPECIES: hypothetical protein [Microbacterium]PNW09686.1 hypothetical protein C1632_04570 [Microbacterium testaceum]REC99690.1 hypothetical protein DEU35_0666 [Microbacterium sp. AG157]WJS91603.1 hypothetical protein NYQ11_03355 [Microbacterium testaceum]GEB44247.1 hypothetical protein MTE01_01920 [Microbacterium testaceum]
MPSFLVWIEYLFWAVIAVGVLVRLGVALGRRRSGRRKDAVRQAIRPVIDAGAVESAFYGWTPSTSGQLRQEPTSIETAQDRDRVPPELPDDRPLR